MPDAVAAIVHPVNAPIAVTVGKQGPPGKTGDPGPGGSASAQASGEILVANTIWIMNHNLELGEEQLNPALWWFEDENGNPMEPADIVWSSNNSAIAQWGDDPVRGKWWFR